MTIEAKNNGTHVMTCDSGGCHMGLIAPSKQELLEDAGMLGWYDHGQQDQCPDCAKGNHPAQSFIKNLIGGDEVTMTAVAPVQQGEAVANADGDVVGHAQGDAAAGEPVKIKLHFPAPELASDGDDADAQASDDDDDDEIDDLFGTDDDDAIAGVGNYTDDNE